MFGMSDPNQTLSQMIRYFEKQFDIKVGPSDMLWESFETVNEINGYFAADLMIDKTRDIVKKLVELEDSVKADEIQSRLKTIKLIIKGSITSTDRL